MTTEYRSTYMPYFKLVPNMYNCSPYCGMRILANEAQKRGPGRLRSTRIKNEIDVGDRLGKYSCSIYKVPRQNSKNTLIRVVREHLGKFVFFTNIIFFFLFTMK